MHTVGVCLQRLSISPFPVKGNFGKLCLYKKSPAGGDEEEDWKSLEAALQGIRTMNFEPGLDRMQEGHRSLLGEHISVQNQHYVNNFVSALTCSTALEQVYINFTRLGLKPGEVASWRLRAYRTPNLFSPGIGRVLAATIAQWSRTKILRVKYVAFTEDELVNFITGLGLKLTDIFLKRVAVQGGGWARPLDVLWEKLGGLESPKKCTVTLEWLTGGGFASKAALYRGHWGGMQYASLCVAATNYVVGRGDMNPLVELERPH